MFGHPRHPPDGRRPARADVSPGPRSARRNEPISSACRVTYNRSTSVTSRGGTWPGPDFFPGLRKLAGVPMRARRARSRLVGTARASPSAGSSSPAGPVRRTAGQFRGEFLEGPVHRISGRLHRPLRRILVLCHATEVEGGLFPTVTGSRGMHGVMPSLPSLAGNGNAIGCPPCLCGGRSQGAWRRNSHGASLMRAIR